MGIRVLPDGSIEATPESGGDPVVFDPQSAALLNIGPPPGVAPPPLPEEELAGLTIEDEAGQALAFTPEGQAVVPPLPEEELAGLTIQDEAGQALAFTPEGQAVVDPATVGLADPYAAPPPAPARAAPLAISGNEAANQLYGDAYAGRDAARQADARAAGMAERIGSEADVRRIAQEAQDQRALAARQQQEEQAYKSAAQQTGEINDQVEELSKKEPDPGRWWANRSSAQKASAYVGAIIQGFLRPGEPNTFVAALVREIDKDVALQAGQIERQLDVLQEQRRQVGVELNRDLERAKGTYAAKALHIESALRQIDAVERVQGRTVQTIKARAALQRVQSEDQERLANTIVANEQAQQQAAENARNARAQRANIYSSIADRKARREIEAKEAQARLVATQAAAAEKARTAEAAKAQQNALGETPGETTVDQLTDADGNIVFRNARRKTSAAKIEETQGAANEASGLIMALLEMGPDERIWNITDDQKTIAAGLREQLVTAMRRALAGPGVTSDKDIALIHQIIPLPGEVFDPMSPEARKAALRQLLLRTEAGVNAQLGPAGIRDVQFRAEPQGSEGYLAAWRSLNDEGTKEGVEAPGLKVSDEQIEGLAGAEIRRQVEAGDFALAGDFDRQAEIRDGIAARERSKVMRENLKRRKEEDPRALAVEEQNQRDKQAIPDLIKAATAGDLRESQMAEMEEIAARRRRRDLPLLGLEAWVPEPGKSGQEMRLDELAEKASSPLADSALSPEELKEFEELVEKRKKAGVDVSEYEPYLEGVK